MYGEINNFVDDEGMSIYNNLDTLNYWYGATVNYLFNNNFHIYLVFRNEGLINQYTNNSVVIENPYKANSLLMGVQFSL